jgi:prophage antirepressor-like protein
MIDSILLVDDENLFHLVFEDACSLLDITLNLKALSSADHAEDYFANLVKENKSKRLYIC